MNVVKRYYHSVYYIRNCILLVILIEMGHVQRLITFGKSLDSFMKMFSLNQLIGAPTSITDSCSCVIDLILESDPEKGPHSHIINF